MKNKKWFEDEIINIAEGWSGGEELLRTVDNLYKSFQDVCTRHAMLKNTLGIVADHPEYLDHSRMAQIAIQEDKPKPDLVDILL